MNNVVVLCAKCKVRLYTLRTIKYPLDYRLFVPYHDGVDNVYDDPMCPFCERPFQVVPNDFRWNTINLQPLLTDKGVFSYEDYKAQANPVSFETPKEEVKGPVCACGCGQSVEAEGEYVHLHRMKQVRRTKMRVRA